MLPDTWANGIDPVMEAEYNYWMDSQFEECQTCDDHYIANEIISKGPNLLVDLD